jgi:AraC family transcriptional regulator
MLILTKRRGSDFFGGCVARKPAGDFTVSLYEYPAHTKIPRHGHDEPYLSFVVQGNYTEQSGPKHSDVVETGVAVLHETGETHADEFHDGRVVLLALQFTPAWREQAEESGIQLKRRRADSFEISRIARKLHFQLTHERARGELSRLGLALELTAELVTDDAEPDRSCASRAQEVVLTDFGSDLSLLTVAEQLNLHPSHVARAFKRKFGCTVGEFIRQVRLNHAVRRLTESDDPASLVAVECGFYDQSHFTAHFRAAMGTTPASYRRRIRKTLWHDSADEEPQEL